jgi:hypothetical protein
MIRRFSLTVCFLVLGSTIADAAVVNIEGTIKSVDAAKRTITVETGKEAKTFDVSSKAKVTLNGEESKLDSLQPGQEVTLSYHDDLEIVLKIVAGTMAQVRDLQLNKEHFDLSGRYKVKDDAIEFLKGTNPKEQSSGKSKETFSPPLAVTYEVTASPDACFDIFPGMLGSIRFRWGVEFNQKTRILLGKERIEIPHIPILPNMKNTIILKVDKNRRFTITVNGKVQYSRIVDDTLELNGPVIIGGGIGHVTYTSVVVDQLDDRRDLKGLLAGTKWINSNNVTFEWTKDGRFLHAGKEREWKVLDQTRVQITFGPGHVDTLEFDDDLKIFKQLIKGEQSSFTGRRQ